MNCGLLLPLDSHSAFLGCSGAAREQPTGAIQLQLQQLMIEFPWCVAVFRIYKASPLKQQIKQTYYI